MGIGHVCARRGQFCKVSVHERSDGHHMVYAECVSENCGVSHAHQVTFACCASHMCNDQHLLDDQPSQNSATSQPLPLPLRLLLPLPWSSCSAGVTLAAALMMMRMVVDVVVV
ncbi:uncharacterized protein LOC143292210 [Babylonia areolata]|uniref:uncharacterized protein LOC143292210 n=1 Tax=Babylonia areolata TaxID=304850 RepID=UPI003FD23293